MVTPALFAKYKTAADYARSPRGVLEREIHSTGFFNSKAKSLRAVGAAIAAEHGGRVPGHDGRARRAARASDARPPTSSSATPSERTRASSSTRTSAASRGASGFTRQTDPVKIEQRSERDRAEGPADARGAPPDLPRTTDLRRPEAPLRRAARSSRCAPKSVCRPPEKARPLDRNQFSGEPAENPVNNPAEMAQKSRNRRVPAPDCTDPLCDRRSASPISDLAGCPTPCAARQNRETGARSFFHTCNRLRE